MKTLTLKQDANGQWQYQFSVGEYTTVAWQYGTYSRDATITQAQERFGKAETIIG